MNHTLKIWPEHYARVSKGTKTFEIRKNDRAFQKGDTVALHAWDPVSGNYCVSKVLNFKIGDVYPIDSERVVFSLLKP